MENFEEKVCLCALNRIFGFEPKMATALISTLGSAREVFALSEKELDALTGPYFKYKGRICPPAVDQAAKELIGLERDGIEFCGWSEDSYPGLLKECEDAPTGLYIRSRTPAKDLWCSSGGIAVVGTRDISPYGKECCCRIVRTISRNPDKPAIISGLALGTDIEAHRTALESGLPTIGVMATGPDDVYPFRHRNFAERMADTPGCALITDYPPGTSPLAIHFLRRNRIIAGLSRAVILVESKIRGGGMMTCRLAFSYDREVYAVPGRMDDTRSQGCNDLIRRKIAEPVTSMEELTVQLGLKTAKASKMISDQERITAAYSGQMPKARIEMMKAMMKTMRTNRGVTIEELSRATGIGIATATELAYLLETDGFITIDLLQRCSINYKNV